MPIIHDLEKFGLSNNEAKIYLACLELGSESIQHIAAVAKLNRVTAYSIIESLLKKGFLREENIKNKRKIAAYPPMKLYDIVSRRQEKLKNQIKLLDALVPELKNKIKTNPEKTNIIYYEGEEGLRNWASDALDTKGELLEWTKIESFTKPFSEYLKNYYYPEKYQKQIPTRFILVDTPAARAYAQSYIDDKNASPMKARFIDESLYDTPGFTVIFNNKFSIALPKELRAVTVEDEIIANTMRKIWEFGWFHAKDEVQNKSYSIKL